MKILNRKTEKSSSWLFVINLEIELWIVVFFFFLVFHNRRSLLWLVVIRLSSSRADVVGRVIRRTWEECTIRNCVIASEPTESGEKAKFWLTRQKTDLVCLKANKTEAENSTDGYIFLEIINYRRKFFTRFSPLSLSTRRDCVCCWWIFPIFRFSFAIRQLWYLTIIKLWLVVFIFSFLALTYSEFSHESVLLVRFLNQSLKSCELNFHNFSYFRHFSAALSKLSRRAHILTFSTTDDWPTDPLRWWCAQLRRVIRCEDIIIINFPPSTWTFLLNAQSHSIFSKLFRSDNVKNYEHVHETELREL